MNYVYGWMTELLGKKEMNLNLWSVFKVLTGFLLINDFIHSISAEDCLNHYITKRTGIITSPRYSFSAAPCFKWRIQGGYDKTITISFDYLRTSSNYGRCVNYVQIGPVPSRSYCVSGNRIKPYISNAHDVWIKFRAYDLQENQFRLRYIISKRYEKCEHNEFRCSNGYCIPSVWKCNSLNECGDNSDERSCNNDLAGVCKGIVCNVVTTGSLRCLQPQKICDGTIDCMNKEDEYDGCNRACNKTYHQSYGRIELPSFNSPFNEKYCHYIIHSTIPGRPVQLRFDSFHFPLPSETLEIFNGRDDLSPVIGIYKKSDPPPKLIESTSDSLYIKYTKTTERPGGSFNFTFQTKGICMKHQLSCGLEENCYDHHQKCDSKWDCKQNGLDEMGCDGCSHMEYSCGVSNGRKCYHEDVRCDGKSYCFDYSDEKNCTSDKCGPHRGLFLCANGRCIYETWKCDNSKDDEDGSDEYQCSGSTTRVIIAAVAGSLICSLLLVVALGCTCKLYLLRSRDNCRSRHSTPLSRLQIEIMGRRPPPPSYNEAMLTSRPYEEVRQEFLSRNNTAVGGDTDMSSRPLPVPPYEPFAQNVLESERTSSENIRSEVNDSDTETSGCDNPNYEDSDDELLDLADDSVHIDLSQDVNILAAWTSTTNLSTSEDHSGDTQLLDLSTKSSKKCDKKTKTLSELSGSSSSSSYVSDDTNIPQEETNIPLDVSTIPSTDTNQDLRDDTDVILDSSDTVPLI